MIIADLQCHLESTIFTIFVSSIGPAWRVLAQEDLNIFQPVPFVCFQAHWGSREKISSVLGGLRSWYVVSFRLFLAALGGYTCLRYVDPDSQRLGSFEPVDGGEGRACRGNGPTDNSQDSVLELISFCSPSFFTLFEAFSWVFECRFPSFQCGFFLRFDALSLCVPVNARLPVARTALQDYFRAVSGP